MLLTRRFALHRSIAMLMKQRFGGAKHSELSHDDHHDADHDDHGHHGHHHKPYDWRDDHSKNLDFEENVLHRGTPDPREYQFPFHADTVQWVYSHPESYNQKNLNAVLTHVKQVDGLHNEYRAPVGDIQADIAHEYDYESEDVDFQPQSFKTQHFRKKGKFAIWVLVGLLPYIFVSSEFFLQKFPDEYHWRLQRPPPFEYPDPEDTPDGKDFKLFQSAEYKYLQEAGIVGNPFFTIQDGKKIYTKEAGVNQPMDQI